jgi:hypothetical protein
MTVSNEDVRLRLTILLRKGVNIRLRIKGEYDAAALYVRLFNQDQDTNWVFRFSGGDILDDLLLSAAEAIVRRLLEDAKGASSPDGDWRPLPPSSNFDLAS